MSRDADGSKHDGALVRVVIADDHEPIRFLLRTLLEFVPTLDVVGEAADGRQAVDLVLAHQADIALLDVEMPVMDGFLAAQLIGSHRPSTRVILHTAHAEPIKQARRRRSRSAIARQARIRRDDHRCRGQVRYGQQGVPGPRAVEAVVLAALAAHSDRPMVVASAEREIPFYNAEAAELLDLPIPAEAMTLAQLREAHPLVDRLGEPFDRDESPLEWALIGESNETGELSDLLPEGALRP